MKKLTLPQTLPLLPVLPALLLLAVLPAGNLHASAGQPANSASKTDKLGEALAARDSGDLLTAQKDFEALLASSPGNAELQRYLNEVNAKIAASPDLAAKAKATADKMAKSAADKEAKQKLDAAQAEQKRLNGIYSGASKDAKAKAGEGDFEGAAAALDAGIKELGAASGAKDLVASLQAEKADLPVQKIELLLKQGKIDEAKAGFADYKKAAPTSPKIAMLDADIDDAELHPATPTLKAVSPGFIDQQKKVANLVAKGRAQYNGGALEEAMRTFDIVLGTDGLNREAEYFKQQIDLKLQTAAREARESTSESMLLQVTRGWELPSAHVNNDTTSAKRDVDNKAMKDKLDSIMIPTIKLNGVGMVPLADLLMDLAKKNDASGVGVNIVPSPSDPKKPAPSVDLSLTVPVSMTTLLNYIAEKINYEVVVERDVVRLHPADIGGAGMETVLIPINAPTVIRLKNAGGASTASTDSADPFAGGNAPTASGDSGSIQSFLQNAGVSFGPGSNLIYDGTAIIVTQTSRNLDRIRNILGRYNDVKQVSIETKFLEVTQGNLNEMSVNWALARNNGRVTGQTPYRSLNTTFATAAGTANAGVLVASAGTDSSGQPLGPPITLPIINNPPTFPGVGDLAGEVTTDLFHAAHVIGSFDVTALVRALDRKTGTELLSSPSVTVLSGNAASIAIAQELRYPRSYSDARVTTAGSSGGGQGGGGGGGGSVAIASGTPQDFDTRRIGVELKVTPLVEADDYNISLELAPIVTEFEGFVEYGGPNVAATSGSTLSAPSGFFQPVFSVREITTKVEIWDGATLVMGGLTREQVRKLNDKTPLLGDLPLIGRLFQSKGETTEKRNLLIFVTANLIGQGGALKNHQIGDVLPGTMYQSANVSTPGGPESRRASTTAPVDSH